MVNTNKPSREAKLRIARMEANRELHQRRVLRRKRDNVIALIAMAVALLVATVLALTVFTPTDDGDAAASDAVASAPASAAPSATPSATAAAVESNSPTVPDAATAKDKLFTGTLSPNGKSLAVELDGTKAPQAVFKSLADSGFLTGKTCHRLAKSPNFGLLQCGSPAGDGQGDPNYQWGPVENTPADGSYPAGTIAVARANSTFSNGTQFFITFEDTVLPQETGGYTMVGKVTSGLEAVQEIAKDGIAGDVTDGAPKTKVTIDSFQIN